MAPARTGPGDAALEHAFSRVRELRAAIGRLRAEQEELTRARDVAILELVAGGLSYEAVAQAAGLTRGRVGQIVQRRGG